MSSVFAKLLAQREEVKYVPGICPIVLPIAILGKMDMPPINIYLLFLYKLHPLQKFLLLVRLTKHQRQYVTRP